MSTIIEQPIPLPSPETCFRWPITVAKDMADSIHLHVLNMLSRSRLVRNVEGIQLVRKEDILSMEEVLGSGAFSQVTAVTTTDGQKYACKHLKQTLMSQPESFRLAASELAYEAHVLASFDHPHILKIRGWAYNGIASFEEGWHDSFFLLLDKLEETLDQRIDRWLAEEHNVTCNTILSQQQTRSTSPLYHQINPCILGGLSPPQTIPSVVVNHSLDQQQQQHILDLRYQQQYLEKLGIVSGIASALQYIHDRGVIFRDLKPNNIGFLDGRVQLFDFGLSRELPSLDTSTPFEMSGKVGTLRYMSPEIALSQSYNLSADVYSLAMVSYEMLSLQKPFEGWTRDMHTAFVCTQGLRPDTSNCLIGIPFGMRILLEQSWHTNPSVRPTMSGILSEVHVMEEQQLIKVNDMQLQMMELSRQMEMAQAQQEAAAVAELATATAVAQASAALAQQQAVDMAFLHAAATASSCSSSSPWKQHFRGASSDSCNETAETSYMSDDSYGFF